MILNFVAKSLKSFTKTYQNEEDILTDCNPADDG